MWILPVHLASTCLLLTDVILSVTEIYHPKIGAALRQRSELTNMYLCICMNVCFFPPDDDVDVAVFRPAGLCALSDSGGHNLRHSGGAP